MKEIFIKNHRTGTEVEIKNGKMRVEIREDCIYFYPKDENFPFNDNQRVMLFKDFSNLDTVNKMLAIFGYEIVKPLIDFTKPLAEELKRLADEDEWKADWGDKIQEKVYIFYGYQDKKFYTSSDLTTKLIGVSYFDKNRVNVIYDYIMKHKEEAVKAMEL